MAQERTATTQALFQGYGDSMARAFEYAAVPTIFTFIGYFIDRKVGTVPLFAIVFFLIAITGMFVRSWYTYDNTMRQYEAELKNRDVVDD